MGCASSPFYKSQRNLSLVSHFLIMYQEESIIVITLIAAAFAAFAQYLFKRYVPAFDLKKHHIKQLFKNKGLWAGGVVYLVSLVIYLKALKTGELSFVYPTFASTFIFVSIISRYLLGEKFNRKRVFGILLIIIGITIVALTY